MFALVDGNNFYVSCERAFRPSLLGRAEQQAAAAAVAQQQVQALRNELEAERRRAAAADERADLYRTGRDQAIDELRALRPQRGRDLER